MSKLLTYEKAVNCILLALFTVLIFLVVDAFARINKVDHKQEQVYAKFEQRYPELHAHLQKIKHCNESVNVKDEFLSISQCDEHVISKVDKQTANRLRVVLAYRNSAVTSLSYAKFERQ